MPSFCFKKKKEKRFDFLKNATNYALLKKYLFLLHNVTYNVIKFFIC